MKQYPNLNRQDHKAMQNAPLVGAGVGGLAGSGLGALFAKLTGLVNPAAGLGIGAGLGALSGGLVGNSIQNTYNEALTPDELAYLSKLSQQLDYRNSINY